MFGFFLLMLSVQSVQDPIIYLIYIPKVGISARIGLIHWNVRSRVYGLRNSFSVHCDLLARVYVARLDYILTLLGIIYVIYRFRIWIKLFFTLFFVIFAK